jgi:rRNA-processing protein FCF1
VIPRKLLDAAAKKFANVHHGREYPSALVNITFRQRDHLHLATQCQELTRGRLLERKFTQRRCM